MDGGGQLGWRSAVVPVPARGRVRVGGSVEAADTPRRRAIDAMAQWFESGDRPLWLVEGAAGTGKTHLAAEVADLVVTAGWPAGWVRPGMGARAASAAARTAPRALVLVDDAETRADLFDLLRIVANGGRPLGVRVVVIARNFGPWWPALLARVSPTEPGLLTAGRTVMGSAGVSTPSPRALALREPRGGADEQGRAVTALATADPATPALLLRQAAVVVALSTRVGQLGPAEVRAAQRDLFEEEGHWRTTAAEVAFSGQPAPALRSALATAAIVGTDGLDDTATVLRRVPALALGAADRLSRVALWWHGQFAATGEAAVPTPRLPAWLADRLPNGADSTGISWAVATLNVDRLVTSTLAQLTVDLHRDVWLGHAPAPREAPPGSTGAVTALRRSVAATAPVDEALAWLARELELEHSELEAIAEGISYPARSLRRTAIVLTRRLLDAATSPAQRASLMLALGARYSELAQWPQARGHTEMAVAELRPLVERDRDRHLPDFAAAVSNLASCLAQLGERDEALQASYQAVSLHRELLETDRERFLPDLARALSNLSACLSRSGRRPAALGAAGQAVAIYRELAAAQPDAYATEMAAAEHNWRVCRTAIGQHTAGRTPVVV